MPRIYVASLSDYNHGVLHGRWIDCDQDVDDVWDEINKMLAESPTFRRHPDMGPAEEHAIHDYDGFGVYRVGEYESIEHVIEIAEGIAEHGEAFAAYASLPDGDRPGLDKFQDCFLGEWETLVEYAREYVDDVYGDPTAKFENSSLAQYIEFNYEAFARDLNSDLTVVDAPNGGVYVFNMEQ